ncbi:uracil-xanthine permease family protein [Alkaliphilus transvaalensis]|uniref:uracil-xanthine permease family protein n=1 Tax=Alkaliphilus transvaalensis TaxID=114628 RepID=UPI0005508D4B|nr:solute carrier family 23 protein [Alkaliphilus transvaalensis]
MKKGRETHDEPMTIIREEDTLPMNKIVILGIQHAFTMFGATVLVPIITGLNPAVALFMAGVGTLIFHLITKGKVPVFLGSSFAFIAPILAVATHHNFAVEGSPEVGLAYAQGGLVVAGIIYIMVAALVYAFGYQRIVSYFPPVVTGPIIMVIGLKLAPVAIDMASEHWTLAIVSFLIVAIVSVFGKGFLKLLPVMCGLIGGYLVAVITGNVEFAPVVNAKIIGIPEFVMAKFDFQAIMIIAPIAIATMVEHIGDVLAIGATVEKDFMESPGLHRTILGDGIATSLSAMFGGPANTTYSENTGVLALTGVHKSLVMRAAAVFAIILGIVPKLGGIIATIPTAVVGGISIILFGMIAAIGGRTLVENKVDFGKSRNLIITAVILVLGLGGAVLPIAIGNFAFDMEGMALAAIVGIVLNKLLPD